MSILTIKTYRYEFSAEIMALIAEFARNHQFDDRKIYKENWLSWTKTNADLVETELSRVMRLGYSGNIADKMFKAGRYYFRKKVAADTAAPAARRAYSNISQVVLAAMDTHIRAALTRLDAGFAPSGYYNSFCRENNALLSHEINRMFMESATNLEASLVAAKIKKTYKNRYYRITVAIKEKGAGKIGTAEIR